MYRKISIAFGAIGIAAIASQSACAAVTVLGNSLAHSCFEVAEFGGNPKEGIAICSEALDQSAMPPKDRAATLVNRGILLSRDERPELALADYDKGLSIDPTLGEAFVDRGAALIVLRRYDEALQAINTGIGMGANRLQIAYYDRAIVEEALGNVRAAFEDYKMATQIEPDFALASAQLSRFKVVHKRPDGT